MKKRFQVTKRCLWQTFEEFDQFGQSVKFNYNGKETIKSLPGSVVSIFLYFVLLAFIVQRLQQLITYNNPVISQALLTNIYDASHQFDLTENGFKIAFGVNNFRTAAPLDDPNIVSWYVRLVYGLN